MKKFWIVLISVIMLVACTACDCSCSDNGGGKDSSGYETPILPI